MTTNYDCAEFEIALVEQKNHVTIKCIHKMTFKNYEAIYTEKLIAELYSIDIKNFCEICKTSFGVL